MRPSERVSQISSLPCRILLIACVLECSMQQWQSSNPQTSRHAFCGNQAHKYHSSCRHTAPSDEHHRGAYRTLMTQGYTQTPVSDLLWDIDCHWLGWASIYSRVASPTCAVDRHLGGLWAGQAEMQPVVIFSFNTKISDFSMSLCRHIHRIRGQLLEELFTLYHKIGPISNLGSGGTTSACRPPHVDATAIPTAAWAIACCSDSVQNWGFISRAKLIDLCLFEQNTPAIGKIPYSTDVM